MESKKILNRIGGHGTFGWASDNVLAIITPFELFHWAKDGRSVPVKYFSPITLSPSFWLLNNQLHRKPFKATIKCTIDSTQQWICAYGSDNLLLETLELRVYESVSGTVVLHEKEAVACFAGYADTTASSPSVVLVTASEAKVSLMW